jgi:hypothetical protein
MTSLFRSILNALLNQSHHSRLVFFHLGQFSVHLRLVFLHLCFHLSQFGIGVFNIWHHFIDKEFLEGLDHTFPFIVTGYFFAVN